MTTPMPIAPAVSSSCASGVSGVSGAPIACTLGAGEYGERRAWIAELNRSALRSHRRAGRTLVLDYAPGVAARVHELVAREQACCAFLCFQVDKTPAAVRLTIEAPAEAAVALDTIFAPFLSGVPVASPPPDRGGYVGEQPGDGSTSSGRAPGITAGTAAVVALACGVCCVLPFALPAVALATFGGVLAAFARVYWWALGGAVAAVAAAWLWIGWQSLRSRRRPAPATLRAMAVASLLLGAAASWPYLEPLVTRVLRT